MAPAVLIREGLEDLLRRTSMEAQRRRFRQACDLLSKPVKGLGLRGLGAQAPNFKDIQRTSAGLCSERVE